MAAVTVEIAFQPFEMVQEDDELPDASYLEQEDFAERLAEYQAGDFHLIGIRASCDVIIDGFARETIVSPGLWGIESDSPRDYLRDVYQEECEALRDILAQRFGDIVPSEPCLACGAPVPPWEDAAAHDDGCPLA